METHYDIKPLSLVHAQALTKWFNLFVDQDLGIVENFHVSVQSEIEYISQYSSDIGNGKPLSYVILHNREIVGKSDIRPLPRDIDKHVVELGFGLLDGHTKAGEQLLTFMMEEVKRRGFEIALYFILGRNRHFRNLFKNVGFQEVGRISKFYKRNGVYDDRIILERNLM
ncbi:MAG: hypothetical protein A2784_00900 [Candidatus Chisholmbacteria bacterium RIFCSPHIGHO2_01_FULL_48_12]|uniref:N-acetyltransferase domain-containing protein n=2 Tax=Patescibacteria group TaxID=1783273 RepID=A0A1G1VS36_9BACT|nr:MAG: hypothetical protein A2784_00900 [Candidatus Chisholmbacteria bacterium RIFCSPHIGHO2_01_FULL_48_12]OGZ40702.1 MAG: hypothetical protein A3I20_01045 [Candidatus Portnoybacteria bacterium RIFCSPLOWO2_02_FULL_40_15]